MISYNKGEDPSKTLDQLCFILKARMTNEAAVERYEHRNTWYDEMWANFSNDVWTNSHYNKDRNKNKGGNK